MIFTISFHHIHVWSYISSQPSGPASQPEEGGADGCTYVITNSQFPDPMFRSTCSAYDGISMVIHG